MGPRRAHQRRPGRNRGSLRHRAGSLEYLILIGFYGLPLDFLDTYVDRIRAVSLTDIGAAFKRRMDPAGLVTVTVGPEGKPPPGAPAPPLEPAPGGRHH
jgi:predicted Zn-dependent peptidase